MAFKPDKFQKAFLEAFDQNTYGFKDDFMILTGDAGTGKTELIREMIKILKEKEISNQTTALTGRAAAVLADRGIESPLTLHKWLVKISDPLLIRNYQNSKGFVLIIDESSMISNGYEIFEERENRDSHYQ